MLFMIQLIHLIDAGGLDLFVIPVEPFHIQFREESAKSCHFVPCQVRNKLEDFLWRKYVLGSRWPRIKTLTCPMGCIPRALKSQKYITKDH